MWLHNLQCLLNKKPPVTLGKSLLMFLLPVYKITI